MIKHKRTFQQGQKIQCIRTWSIGQYSILQGKVYKVVSNFIPGKVQVLGMPTAWPNWLFTLEEGWPSKSHE